ncbi:hypothetical protein [Nocardia carnea]|uniref:hypothetical protein n=1 Tax=Nocardia carnea TaxID=37328 RepID=UPI0024545CAE|nr:hypothetical protein [Nocardia carnea]
MSIPDLGRQAGIRLHDAARAGEFRMSEEVARELAASCDRLVERLQAARNGAAELTQVAGFPELPSGRALTAGFSAKGRELLDVLTAFEQAALRHKAAYLAAAALFEEADAANAAALAAALADTGPITAS